MPGPTPQVNKQLKSILVNEDKTKSFRLAFFLRILL
ncbi:MAG: hypothetical protein ACI86C_000715, partial [Candidatus Latescibacterota bacterium]